MGRVLSILRLQMIIWYKIRHKATTLMIYVVYKQYPCKKKHLYKISMTLLNLGLFPQLLF
ncbi:hypothetical protein HanPI659440_Chr13g0501321 [Helianthus annuus]|nr:hypothetical protein HanPI659440_Chr13g0501321 [Helianthus annuus]